MINILFIFGSKYKVGPEEIQTHIAIYDIYMMYIDITSRNSFNLTTQTVFAVFDSKFDHSKDMF